MRDSPMAALGFLIGLALVPATIFYGLAWGALRYSEGGLLIYRSEVSVSTTLRGSDSADEMNGLRCSYFTGTRVLERKFSYEELSYDDAGLFRKGSCPWWVDAS